MAIKYDYTGPASTIAKVKFPVNVTDEFAGVRERLGAALTSKETRFSKNYRKQLAQLTVLSQRGTGGYSSPKGDVHESGRGKGGEHRGDDPGVAEVVWSLLPGLARHGLISGGYEVLTWAGHEPEYIVTPYGEWFLTMLAESK